MLHSPLHRHTERGVTTVADPDSGWEYASSADEARAAFNRARDEAFKNAEDLLTALDALYDTPRADRAASMALLAMRIKLALGLARECAP